MRIEKNQRIQESGEWKEYWNDGMLGRESEAELNDAGRRRSGDAARKARGQRTQIDIGELRISNLEIGNWVRSN